MTIFPKFTIEKAAYEDFMDRYKKEEFGTQRLGQAFFDYFKLQKMNNNQLADTLYYVDDVTAKDLIKDNFNFH